MQRPLPNGALTVSPVIYHRPSVMLDYSMSLILPNLDLKYDNCNVPAIWEDEYNYCVADSDIPGVDTSVHCVETTDPAPPGYNWATSNTTKRYNRMRDALVSVQDINVILFSLCEWGYADVVAWGAGTGNSWRVSGDINGVFFTQKSGLGFLFEL